MKKIGNIVLYFIDGLLPITAVCTLVACALFSGQHARKDLSQQLQQYRDAVIAQANINGEQAVELLQQPTWYWVAPGIVSSTLDGTGTRIDYNSGISVAVTELHHPLDRNGHRPGKLAFVRNVNNSTESVCGGLLTVSEVN